MNTRIKNLAPIIVIAVVAAVLASLGSVRTLAAQSPISPIPPSGLPNDNCLGQCLTAYPKADEDWCQCYCQGGMTGRCGSVPPSDPVGGTPCPEPTVSAASDPKPSPTPIFCPPWWPELSPWMGLYELRTNGTQYCIGSRLH